MLKSATVIFVFISLVIPSSTVPFAYDWAELDDENRIDQHRQKIDPDNPPLGPYFDYDFFRNETIMVGDIAYLKCRVHNIQNKTVSWVRHLDINLLTVGTVMYTSDTRFQSMHDADTEEWTLKLKNAQLKDSGAYECQISTTPPTGYPVYLSVVEPITQILGVREDDETGEIFINMGSTINLTCIVRNLPEPSSIHWTHNREEISYDSPRGGVSVITEKGDITTSYLLIQRARSSDSGEYKCTPSNAHPKTVHVHILKGEHPEAMQSTGSSFSGRRQIRATIFLFSIIFVAQVMFGR
ncbi:hypothetical protein PVAND_010604 [Polypedilum vanderplanki]|uniref:Ig-like domain-containing protein n=1 Tax=Polypedilum vanderplanki TaxID=319348 RepID=A0A9J6CH29_POLVA|nr:hypothetical protein PVAND_010604 [Polypedilum vanderplanki]